MSAQNDDGGGTAERAHALDWGQRSMCVCVFALLRHFISNLPTSTAKPLLDAHKTSISIKRAGDIIGVGVMVMPCVPEQT